MQKQERHGGGSDPIRELPRETRRLNVNVGDIEVTLSGKALAPATPQPRPHTRDTARSSQNQPATAAALAIDDAPAPF